MSDLRLLLLFALALAVVAVVALLALWLTRPRGAHRDRLNSRRR